ncbi:MAG: SGNH/GDSL hydrolase family protein [Rhodobacteraceae bacterium]|nr:SGNH/GDSL hydrolase family protein [Paracoccaceae bacterium]
MIPLDVLARPVLLPVLLTQGRAVRRKALILPEPGGPRSGQTGTGPALRVLIAGDSSAAGVGAKTQNDALAGQVAAALAPDFAVDWRLVAETGASTATMHATLSQMNPERFDVAILALGVNDVTGAVTRRRWIARQSGLHRMLQGRFGVQRIYASGLPPMGLFPLLPQPLRWILGAQATRLDKALAGIAARDEVVHHIPFDLPHEARYFAEDGYHPSPPAYALWAGVLAGLIRRDHPRGISTN